VPDLPRADAGDRVAGSSLGFDPGTMIHRARGCGECGQSGYKGRVGLFEAVRSMTISGA
jgi:general secretion pathway protein E